MDAAAIANRFIAKKRSRLIEREHRRILVRTAPVVTHRPLHVESLSTAHSQSLRFVGDQTATMPDKGSLCDKPYLLRATMLPLQHPAADIPVAVDTYIMLAVLAST